MTFSKNGTWIALTLCAASLANGTGNAYAKETAQQSAARHAIAAEYLKADHAAMKKNIAGMMAATSPDFLYVRASGIQFNRAQFEAGQKSILSMKGFRLTKVQSKIQKIEWHGKEAIISVDSSSTAIFRGRKIVDTGQMQDSWRQTAKGWMIYQSVCLNSKTTVDGKVVPAG